jgi:hypothetical protein
MQLLYNDEGSPKRLAEDIAKDRLFCYYATDEISRQIFDELMYVEKKRRGNESKEILKRLLKVFEHARAR